MPHTIMLSPGTYLHALDAMAARWTHDNARMISFGVDLALDHPFHVGALAVDPVYGESLTAHMWDEHAALVSMVRNWIV